MGSHLFGFDHLLAILPQILDLHQRADTLARDDYNVFHHAGTLIVICAKPALHHAADDCFLAAQNLMLAAHGMGHIIGSVEVGKLADLVLWKPALFGAKQTDEVSSG